MAHEINACENDDDDVTYIYGIGGQLIGILDDTNDNYDGDNYNTDNADDIDLDLAYEFVNDRVAISTTLTILSCAWQIATNVLSALMSVIVAILYRYRWVCTFYWQ